MIKNVIQISTNQARFKPVSATTEINQGIEIADLNVVRRQGSKHKLYIHAC